QDNLCSQYFLLVSLYVISGVCRISDRCCDHCRSLHPAFYCRLCRGPGISGEQQDNGFLVPRKGKRNGCIDLFFRTVWGDGDFFPSDGLVNAILRMAMEFYCYGSHRDPINLCMVKIHLWSEGPSAD